MNLGVELLPLVEGNVLVDSRLGGQAEDTLADDVALDLVAATGDPVARGAEHVLAPAVRSPLAGVGREPWAEQQRCDLAGMGHAVGPHQLAERALWARASARPSARPRPAGSSSGRLVMFDVARRRAPGERWARRFDPRWLASARSCLKPAADGPRRRRPRVVTFESEAGQRNPPAVADTAQAMLGVAEANVGHEDLVEVGAAGHLLDRSDLDARRLETARGTR